MFSMFDQPSFWEAFHNPWRVAVTVIAQKLVIQERVFIGCTQIEFGIFLKSDTEMPEVLCSADEEPRHVFGRDDTSPVYGGAVVIPC
jgi:hypothetical protein